MSVLDLSKNYLLNETENKILQCLVEELEADDSKVSVRDVAAKAYVSTALVVKLAKKLGYEGYSDLVYSLRRRLAQERAGTGAIDLSHILAKPDAAAIEAFADALCEFRQRTVFIVGLGFSTITSAYMMKRLATLSIMAYDGDPVDVFTGPKEPSLVIFLSKSGETKDLVEIARNARETGHRLVTITGREGSTLSRMSEVCLPIRLEGNLLPGVPDFFVGRSIILFEYVLSKLMERLVRLD